MNDAILQRLGLGGKDPSTNHLVSCPLHRDSHPSCSVHPAKGVYHCFSCGSKGTLAKLAEQLDLQGGPTTSASPTAPLVAHVSPEEVQEAADRFRRERGLPFDFQPDLDPASPTYGYVEIPDYQGNVSSWRRLFPGEPKYRNSPGPKGTYCAQPPLRTPGSPVWLVEGQLDALAIRAAGARGGIYALQTCELPEDLAFALQDYHVLLALDNDVAGFRGAKRASETLRELEIPHSRLQVRPWKDAGEAWAEDPTRLSDWVRQKEANVAPDERDYVQRWLQGGSPMLVIPTGYADFDRVMGGGYKPGLHAMQGMTSVGKSSWAVRLAYHAAALGQKVIYVTTELTKHQLWARVASCIPGAPSWVRLEQDPAALPFELRPQIEALSDRIRVLGNRSVKQISNDVRSHGATLLIVDYLQRLRGAAVEGEGVNAASLGALTGELSDLSQSREMVVLAISSISRASYESGGGIGGAKGSGDVEFFSQSLVSMVRPPGHHDVTFRVEKNTRGEVGGQIQLPYFPLNCGFAMTT